MNKLAEIGAIADLLIGRSGTPEETTAAAATHR
jgi:hypothetical protein